MFGQHSHHVGEALIYGDVQRRAQRVVEEVDVGAFAQQQPRNLCLITERIERERETHAEIVLNTLFLKICLAERALSNINFLFGSFY